MKEMIKPRFDSFNKNGALQMSANEVKILKNFCEDPHSFAEKVSKIFRIRSIFGFHKRVGFLAKSSRIHKCR